MNKIFRTSLALAIFFAGITAAQTGQEPQKQPPPGKEHKITPEETKELLQSVDDILHFASERTLLPIKLPVKKNMVSRAEVEKYIEEKFQDDVDRIRFERSELVLKKFGLLPRKFDLHSFLIKLLGEQVAGYYDEKTGTINLLDWVELEMQRPVMAHELTHALQDQSYDLAKMMKKDEEIEKRGPEDPNAIIQIDEESSCRTAVLEGQAMIVLLDYMLTPAGRTVEDSPKFVDRMQAQMEKHGDSPIFDSAPLLLREELVFPYSQGMKFIEQLLIHGGKKQAYAGVLAHLPLTTREILEPEEYLAGRRIPPLYLPDFGFLKKDYDAFDAGAMGELDVSVLLKQYANDETAARISTGWRGGAYYAAGRKGPKPGDANSTAHIGLLYVSKWSSEAVARDFAKVYVSALPQRYGKAEHAQTKDSTRDQYNTSDGPIFIERHGDLVVIVESFDEATADKLLQAALKKAQEQGTQAGK
ncbi:MAG TPA: hypothetical protein VN176_12225 [Verrucomicrobiae bacterium]|jgi:hypothetical protein|nr:hypothetical protein [Verrucomicrobiae bacterium]